MKKTINITDLAQRLGVTRQTIHNMLKEDRIPLKQIKGFKTPRWTAADVEKWITSDEKA